MICDDEGSCLDVAQALLDTGDYYSAMRWLQNGNIPESNTLYASAKKKISDSKKTQNLPNALDVIDIEGESLLTNVDATHSFAGIKNLCDEEAASCKKIWEFIVTPNITSLKQMVEDEETARIKKQQEEETARLRKQKEEEDARLRKQKEEEQMALLQEQEEAAERKKKLRRKIFFIYVPSALFIIGLIIPSSKTSGSESSGFSNAFANGMIMVIGYFMMVLTFYFYYFIYKLLKKLFKRWF
jgi:cation transport ATPase